MDVAGEPVESTPGGASTVPPQPILRDGGIVLRPWTYDDIEAARHQHDVEMAHWFGFPDVVPTAERQRTWIDHSHHAYLADRSEVVFLVEHHGGVAGTVDVKQRGDGVGALSWAVFPAHRGIGVGTRAVRLLIDYCFAELGLRRVQAHVERGNLASERTAGRAGLRREGIARGVETVGDRLADMVVLARLRDDPPPTTREGFNGVLNAALPTKHLITQGVLRSTAGRTLLCELTYKPEWDLPGGIVDPGEAAGSALRREVLEELAVDLPVQGLLAVNWLPPWKGWDDACQLVFDLGEYDERLAEQMVLERREIAAVHWCSPSEAAAHVAPYLRTLLDRLLPVRPDRTLYLEAGNPVT